RVERFQLRTHRILLCSWRCTILSASGTGMIHIVLGGPAMSTAPRASMVQLTAPPDQPVRPRTRLRPGCAGSAQCTVESPTVRVAFSAHGANGAARQTYGPTLQSVQRRAVRHERARGPVSDQASEVPVVVFGVLGLADDIGRSRTGEEVVVLIAAGRERR